MMFDEATIAMLKSLYYIFILFQFGSAHMEMTSPFPIRSNVDPAAGNKDYDYKKPLEADGSDFPCKLYQNDVPEVSKATYIAGQSYQMTVKGEAELAGGSTDAVHGGGSCQLSLSYDNGKLFHIIKSIIGGFLFRRLTISQCLALRHRLT